MSAEIRRDEVQKFEPLFKASSAREALSAAEEIVQNRSSEDQRKLLLDPDFQKPVRSAIANLDQRRESGENQIVNSFDEELQPAAKYIFGRD